MAGTAQTALGGWPRTTSPVDRFLDRLGDVLLLGFGLWTVLYHLACWLGVRTTPLLAVTAAGTLAAAPWVWRRRYEAGTRAPVLRTRAGLAAGAASLVLATAAVVVLAWGDDAAYPWGWGLGLAALLPVVALLVRRGVHDPGDPAVAQRSPGGLLASAFAVAAGLAFAVLALFIYNVSHDDIFYVNKAVFVAEHGTIPLRDTVYTDQVLPALRGAGTVPVQSVEVLQGAVAHLLGIAGGTVAYLGTPFVGAFAAVWVLWALARSWSRGPAVVALALATAYLAWGMWLSPGSSGSIAMSSIFIRALWQGKVLFLFLAVPLCYLLLTRWVRERQLRDVVLLFLLGAGAVGLTSSATFLVPPIAVGAAVALAACRSRAWWGALVLAAYPVGAGVFVATRPGGGAFGDVLRTPAQTFHGVVGAGVWGAVGAAAILLGPLAARAGAARVVAAAGAVVTMLVLAPFATSLFADLTGAGPVLWRLAWVAPLPTLVGIVASALVPAPRPAPRAGDSSVTVRVWLQRLGWLAPVAALAVVVLSGRLIWASSSPARLEPTPVWKYPSESLDRAAYIARLYHGPGPVLAPREVMGALALTTTRIHAVDPRAFFLSALDEPPERNAERRLLSRTMAPGIMDTPRRFGQFLDDLDVGLVCPGVDKAEVRDAVVAKGWQRLGDDPAFPCWERPS